MKRDGRGGRERERLACPATYLCIHWLLLVCALTGDGTQALALKDDALTN